MKKEIEIRNLPQDIAKVQLRQEEDGAHHISGYAGVYDQLSHDLGGFQERFAAGAFDEWIEKNEVWCLHQHNPTLPLGRLLAGTIELNSDDYGLATDCTLANTTIARDLIADVEHGNLTGMSVGFIPVDFSWIKEEDQVIHEVRTAELNHYSPCRIAAYAGTTISARSLESLEEINKPKVSVFMPSVETLEKWQWLKKNG